MAQNTIMLIAEIEKYVEKLANYHPSIQSIWLLGSRANETQRPDSDWDLLAFGTNETIEKLSHNHELNQKNIDLMVVYNGDDFIEPWENLQEGKEPKSGSISGWEWKKTSQTEATYKATKGIESDDGEESFYVKTTLAKAYRIYPC